MVLLISNDLGKAGVTDMGLIVLGISFVVMMNNIIGGSSLVYMASRAKPMSILLPSYAWVFVSVLVMGTIIYFLELVPAKYVFWTIIIGLLECFFSIHIQFFLGKKKIGWYNFLRVFQKAIALLIFILLGITIQNFIYAVLISFAIVALISAIVLYQAVKDYQIIDLNKNFKRLFNYGMQIQSSNILQLLNYRLIYIFIEKTMGEVLGIYIVAVQLAESIWIPSKALSIIQYSTISNEKDTTKHTSISLSFLKISLISTTFLTGILLLIPEDFIGWIFGKDFNGVHYILIGLAIGIISISMNLMFSHYFSGKGIYKYNIYASAIGLIVITASGYFLIREYQLFGAALATSLSYLSSTIYLVIVFKKYTHFKLADLNITKADINRLKRIFSRNK